jgi:adenylate kinase
MRLVLFGPPGVGKGTQANLLCEKYNLLRISTGDLLREQVALSSPIGRRVEQFMKKGHLVPDDIMFEIVDNLLIENKDQDILFDGYPRNLNQARSLEQSLAQFGQAIDLALQLQLADDEIIKRLVSRRYCPKCERVYNYITNPPKVEGLCDYDKQKLVKRNDDTEEIIRKRLAIYEAETRPLISYYKSLNIYREVDAQGNQEDVLHRISIIVDDYINIKCKSN